MLDCPKCQSMAAPCTPQLGVSHLLSGGQMNKHVIQITSLPINNENLDKARTALDTARLWNEKVDITIEWGTISQELRDNIPALSQYIFNTRIPITLLGCPKITENEIYSRVCKFYFETL